MPINILRKHDAVKYATSHWKLKLQQRVECYELQFYSLQTERESLLLLFPI